MTEILSVVYICHLYRISKQVFQNDSHWISIKESTRYVMNYLIIFLKFKFKHPLPGVYNLKQIIVFKAAEKIEIIKEDVNCNQVEWLDRLEFRCWILEECLMHPAGDILFLCISQTFIEYFSSWLIVWHSRWPKHRLKKKLLIDCC